MKTKKLFTGIAVMAMATLLLTACGSKEKETTNNSEKTTTETTKEKPVKKEKVAGGELKDGTYQLVEKNEDDNGWKAEFSMTVKDGKIKESDFDYINKEGQKKSKDKEYQKSMKEKAGVGPADFLPELNEALVTTQSADDVDVVTGATHTSESFKNYAQQLIQAAQAGNTETIEIDNGAELKDGTYALEEKNDANGYHATFNIVVKDGKITESNYDNVNADGKSKKEDKDYNENMKKNAKTNPEIFIPELNKALVEKGNPSDVEVVTGATHSTHSFQMYAAQLVNAAEKGDTTPIIVDNIVTK